LRFVSLDDKIKAIYCKIVNNIERPLFNSLNGCKSRNISIRRIFKSGSQIIPCFPKNVTALLREEKFDSAFSMKQGFSCRKIKLTIAERIENLKRKPI
jgi:hypothetical protein